MCVCVGECVDFWSRALCMWISFERERVSGGNYFSTVFEFCNGKRKISVTELLF